ANLERKVIFLLVYGTLLHGSGSPGRLAHGVGTALAVTGSRAEHGKVLYAYSYLFPVVSGFILPGIGLYLTFHIKLASLFQVLFRNFGQSIPYLQIMPLGIFHPVSVAVLIGFSGCQPKIGNDFITLQILYFGILP